MRFIFIMIVLMSTLHAQEFEEPSSPGTKYLRIHGGYNIDSGEGAEKSEGGYYGITYGHQAGWFGFEIGYSMHNYSLAPVVLPGMTVNKAELKAHTLSLGLSTNPSKRFSLFGGVEGILTDHNYDFSNVVAEGGASKSIVGSSALYGLFVGARLNIPTSQKMDFFLEGKASWWSNFLSLAFEGGEKLQVTEFGAGFRFRF